MSGTAGVAMLVSEAMSRAVVTVAPDDAIERAAEIARSTGAEHLLVLDGEVLVGILCTCDLDEAERGDHVSDRMSLPVVTVRPDARVDEAADALGDYDLGCLPVLLGGLILGIVGDAELERAGVRAPHVHDRRHHRGRRRAVH